MNKYEAIGRLTKNPDIHVSQGEREVTFARFVLAVPRRIKNSNGNYEADFVSCVAFGAQAIFMEKYVKKGNRVAIVGRLQSGNYQKDGATVYKIEVIVEDVENLTPRPADSNDPVPAEDTSGFVPTDNDSGLPFN